VLQAGKVRGDARRGAPAAARVALTALFEAALATLEPRSLVRALFACHRDRLAPVLDRARREGVILVGAGKGAARIAAALEAVLAPAVTGGLVIVPPGYAWPTRRVTVRLARHPVPDRRSVAATRALLAALARRPRSPVLVVLTGGASSLLVLPAAGLTLADKRRAHALLLASGATIAEVNTVRSHLSAVKGGRLAERLRGRPAAAIVLSDVPGDDVAVIGSGPTVPDATTFADAARIVRDYGIGKRLPARVRRHLARGVAGRVRETPKPRATCAPVPTLLLAGNDTACAGAARSARARGYAAVLRLRRPLTGAPRRVARRLAARIRVLRARVRGPLPGVLVAGGETTVRIDEAEIGGRGGRNQELALEVARLLAGESGWLLLCAGTDGVDGPTDAAGAFVDGGTVARAARAGWSVEDALARHDVYPLLAGIGALYRPGPTGTNVADVALALVWRNCGWRVPAAV
jgi:glycerate 2-kinase